MLTPYDVGKCGERFAQNYFHSLGYTVLAAPFRTREGEADVVCRAPEGTLVFAEVKTRRSVRFGEAEEAVDGRKLVRILKAAQAYRQRHGVYGPWRVDVVGITLSRNGRLKNLRHLKDVTL